MNEISNASDDLESGFLAVPETSAEVQRLYDADIEKIGFVMNASKMWAHHPAVHHSLFDLIDQTARAASLTYRQRGVLIAACASALGDSYCSLAWGNRLAREASGEVAGAVLRGDDDHLDQGERALARWARQVARDPNGTSEGDVQELREAGFDDSQICALTVFLGLRVAFSTVNDALGARPDRQLGEQATPSVLDAITYGRPMSARC